jgi:hypothetical protein
MADWIITGFLVRFFGREYFDVQCFLPWRNFPDDMRKDQLAKGHFGL